MDLSAILPIIDEIVKKSLTEKVYSYGHPAKGMGNRVASGNLKNSIKAVEQENKQGVTIIQLTAFGQPLSNTYAYWLINDRAPGYAPVSAIEKWIKEKKSFRIRNMKTGRFLSKNDKNIRSAAFAIVKSMGRFGFQNKPQNFIEVSYDMILKNKEIEKLIGDAAYEDLLNLIEGI